MSPFLMVNILCNFDDFKNPIEVWFALCLLYGLLYSGPAQRAALLSLRSALGQPWWQEHILNGASIQAIYIYKYINIYNIYIYFNIYRYFNIYIYILYIVCIYIYNCRYSPYHWIIRCLLLDAHPQLRLSLNWPSKPCRWSPYKLGWVTGWKTTDSKSEMKHHKIIRFLFFHGEIYFPEVGRISHTKEPPRHR